ncbi:MAG: transposase [Azoarcus sp.]|nr:transposase [Azoarcus sp.]
MCADAGYVGETAKSQIEARGDLPHVRPRGKEIEAKAKNPDYKPRRWVVEACHCWINRFRKLLVRYEKTHRSYNHFIPQQALGHRSPLDALTSWYGQHPELFMAPVMKQDYNQAERDTYRPLYVGALDGELFVSLLIIMAPS